jgi:hypothetical protein
LCPYQGSISLQIVCIHCNTVGLLQGFYTKTVKSYNMLCAVKPASLKFITILVANSFLYGHNWNPAQSLSRMACWIKLVLLLETLIPVQFVVHSTHKTKGNVRDTAIWDIFHSKIY